jgi:hypothetical protein
MCLKKQDQFATHIIGLLMQETHRQQYKSLNIRHKHSNLIKEFTPLRATSPGPASKWIFNIKLLKVLKNIPYSAQIDKLTAPMAPQRPKTPVWALSAPETVEK